MKFKTFIEPAKKTKSLLAEYVSPKGRNFSLPQRFFFYLVRARLEKAQFIIIEETHLTPHSQELCDIIHRFFSDITIIILCSQVPNLTLRFDNCFYLQGEENSLIETTEKYTLSES